MSRIDKEFQSPKDASKTSITLATMCATYKRKVRTSLHLTISSAKQLLDLRFNTTTTTTTNNNNNSNNNNNNNNNNRVTKTPPCLKIPISILVQNMWIPPRMWSPAFGRPRVGGWPNQKRAKKGEHTWLLRRTRKASETKPRKLSKSKKHGNHYELKDGRHKSSFFGGMFYLPSKSIECLQSPICLIIVESVDGLCYGSKEDKQQVHPSQIGGFQVPKWFCQKEVM